MTRIHLTAVFVFGILTGTAPAPSLSAAEQIYAPLSAAETQQKTIDWTNSHPQATDESRAAIARLWAMLPADHDPGTLHEFAVRSFGLVDERIARQLEQCRFGVLTCQQFPVLSDDSLPPFVRCNLQSFVVGFLAQAEFFDEAVSLADKIDPRELIDPAGYFFYRAVGEHRLLKKTDGLSSLKSLLQDTADVPVRYTSVAELMEADLQKLKEKSLDEIQRLMADVERRLGHARSGDKTQEVENTIIKRLDELIEKIEQQQQQQQQQSQQNGGQAQAADDSRIKGTTAPGEVDQRDIGDRAGWGALPPKQQTQAKNLIDRELPPHYRHAIEQYLRKLARRPAGQER